MNNINHQGLYTLLKSNDLDLNKIKQDLELFPIDNYTKYIKKINNYKETKKHLYIPINYGIEKFGIPAINKMNHATEIQVKFNGILRDYQEKIVNTALKELNNTNNTPSGCIISIQTGSGKTVVGLNLISQLCKKTLIIVHKEFLLNQWKERIMQFLPNSKIGIIQGSIIDIEDKDIVIGMLQSIVLKEYPQEIFQDFGMVLIDEVHHLGAEMFSKAFFKIGSKKYNIGLSATPYRKDGLTKIIEWHIGNIITLETYNSISESNTTIKFYNINYSQIPEDKFNSLGKINMPNMITNLIEHKERNEFMLKIILENIKDRKILILSDRISHLKYFKQQLDILTTNSIGLYIGKMKENELKISNKCDVILGSYNMCAEGYDCPDLNTLILISPKSDITQSIGRIFRKKHSNTLIIDFCDMYSVFKIQGYKRKKIYKQIINNALFLNINEYFGIQEIDNNDEILDDLEFIEE